MSDVVFTAARRFDPTCGEAWKKYIAWSGLTQLREVISLDTILCPNIFVELTADDWKHNVHADFRTHLFYGVDHVIAVVGDQPVNVLALMEEPSAAEVTGFTDERFIFRGFDLLEYPLGISALVNCGGFDKAFLPGDLSACGLLVDHEKARTVQERLRTEYPSEPHAQCRLWAIWQKREK